MIELQKVYKQSSGTHITEINHEKDMPFLN